MSLFFALLIAVVCAVAYVGVLWLIRKLVRGHVREGHNDVLVPMFLVLGHRGVGSVRRRQR